MRNALILVLLSVVMPAWGAEGLYTVGTREAAVHMHAPARVRPVQTLIVRVTADGTVQDLKVVPGQHVRRGQVLARIGGTEYATQLAEARSTVAERQAELEVARETLRGVRRTYPGVTTKRRLQQALGAVTEGTARLAAARARLGFVERSGSVTAATDGTVIALQAANGQRVATGDPVLRLVPAGTLWLQADFYGRDAARLRPGLHGQFRPVGGGPPVAVTVRTVVTPQRADGARRVGCVADSGDGEWTNGEGGMLELQGPRRSWTVVPTRALVMDRGRWWVLVHGDHGDRRQAVVPGPTRGDRTLIASGLKAGQQVVVADVYFKFHRDFSRHYQPPD